MVNMLPWLVEREIDMRIDRSRVLGSYPLCFTANPSGLPSSLATHVVRSLYLIV